MSALLRALLLLLALLAALSIWLSAMPPLLLLAVPLLLFASWPAAPATSELLLRTDGSAALVSASHEMQPLDRMRIQFRGPLAVLSFRHGGRRRWHVLLPDTLGVQSRRLLQLWSDRHGGQTRPSARVAGV